MAEQTKETTPELEVLSKSTTASQSKNQTDTIVIKDKYRLYFDSPLSDLSLSHSKAYKVEQIGDNSRKLFAYICTHKLSNRLDLAPKLKNIKNARLLPYIDHDIIYRDSDNQSYVAIIYERPLGGRVANTIKSKITPIKEIDYINKFFRPLFKTIQELFAQNITHRSIRPTNMFYMDEAKTQLVFGDFLTTPPAYEQPTLYETIGSSMCIKEGRGEGSKADDLYSFGASLLFFIFGRNNLSHLSDIEIINTKIKKGSYAALIQEDKVYVSLIELLRGLLNDNEEQRWTIGSIEAWLHGRRLNNIQSKSIKRSQRAFVFNDIEYNTAKDIALAFSRNWSEAVKMMNNEKLEIFLRRGLEDNSTANLLQKISSEVNFRHKDQSVREDLWVANVCVLLDKEAPIRYKGINFYPEGLGTIVAAGFAGDLDFKLIQEILQRDVVTIQISKINDNKLVSKLKILPIYLSKRDLGNGMERVLYELNPRLSCQSPLISSQHPKDISFIVKSLEKVANQVDNKKWPLDRHVVAYIASHFTAKSIDEISAINSPNIAVSTTGMFNLLSILQWEFGPINAYNLCKWLENFIIPLIDTYNNREKRIRLKGELPKVIQNGNISDLLDLLNNAQEKEADIAAFNEAKAEYSIVSNTINHLENDIEKRKAEYLTFGNQIASIISFTIAIFVLFSILILEIF